jgi:hypothetical protein
LKKLVWQVLTILVKLAQSEGWRTFRVTNHLNDLMENEIICPNTTHGTKCIDCKLCSGFSKAKNIVIQVHGAKVKGLLKKLKPFK